MIFTGFTDNDMDCVYFLLFKYFILTSVTILPFGVAWLFLEESKCIVAFCIYYL